MVTVCGSSVTLAITALAELIEPHRRFFEVAACCQDLKDARSAAGPGWLPRRVLVAVLDILKGYLPVLLFEQLGAHEAVDVGVVDHRVGSPHRGDEAPGRELVEVPAQRRKKATRWLTYEKASKHNLRDLTVSLPLGRFVAQAQQRAHGARRSGRDGRRVRIDRGRCGRPRYPGVAAHSVKFERFLPNHR